mmetsp:Transcript_6153/g.13364  ORF Transcript_6153/g.13364 Transcript_6153/m.13364 type:complete len:408 (-) Transcript_6153:452-1675(-)
MIAGTIFWKAQQDATRKQGGPHATEMNAWTGRTVATHTAGTLRGHIAPWSTEPPAPSTTQPAPLSSCHAQQFSNTSTAETDVPSWEDRVKHSDARILSLRGQPNPNYTTSLTRGKKLDPNATVPIAGSVHHSPYAGPYNKWSTAKTDKESWENRTKGSLRGYGAPWMNLYTSTTMADPHAGTLMADTGSGASGTGNADSATSRRRQAGPLNTWSTASVDVSSWDERVKGKLGPYTTTLTSTLRGHKAPNAERGLGQGDTKTLVPQPLGPTEPSLPDPNSTSTAAVDMASWSMRLSGGRPATTGFTLRGQRDPWAQTLTESTARPGTVPLYSSSGPTSPGARGTGRGSGGTGVLNAWSTSSVDKDSWEARVNRVYPDQLAFKSTRGATLIDTYIRDGHGFTGRSMVQV